MLGEPDSEAFPISPRTGIQLIRFAKQSSEKQGNVNAEMQAKGIMPKRIRNPLSLEEVFCSRTNLKILSFLKQCRQLDTSSVARKIHVNYAYADSRLKLLEEQGILTHSNYGKRSRICRFSESPRAKAVLSVLEVCEA